MAPPQTRSSGSRGPPQRNLVGQKPEPLPSWYMCRLNRSGTRPRRQFSHAERHETGRRTASASYPVLQTIGYLRRTTHDLREGTTPEAWANQRAVPVKRRPFMKPRESHAGRRTDGPAGRRKHPSPLRTNATPSRGEGSRLTTDQAESAPSGRQSMAGATSDRARSENFRTTEPTERTATRWNVADSTRTW